jgi:hypothetical protein
MLIILVLMLFYLLTCIVQPFEINNVQSKINKRIAQNVCV